ncbi:MAG: GTP-binding protein [Promethearchaeota archaeon]
MAKQNLFKVVVIGDGAVGKTSITVRICHGQFDGEYLMTIGVEFGMKLCMIMGQKIKMQIWDTAGQERFRFLQPAYYSGAHGALVVYDVTRRQSFERIPIWLGYLVGNVGTSIPTIIVGNKCDLDDIRSVDVDEGEHLAKHLSEHYQQDIPFFEASAKTNQNVEEIFLRLGKMMLDERLFEVEKAVEWKERAKNDWW